MQRTRAGLEKIVTKALERTPREQAVLWAWPFVCGSTVAEKTEAVHFQDGVLQVVVPEETWCEQLEAFVPQYMHSLEKFTGVRLQGIKFEVAGRRAAPGGRR